MSFHSEKGFSKKVLLSVFSASLIVLTGVAAQANPKVEREPEHVPGELIVKFRDSSNSRRVQANIIQSLQKALGKSAVLGVRPFETDNSLVVMKMKNDQMVRSAMGIMASESGVAFSEPNYIYRTSVRTTSPNDPEFEKNWSMNNSGQSDSAGQAGTPGSDVNVMPLWLKGITGSKRIVVAVIDTGIQWDHPDLKDNLYVNAGEIADNGIDDDGNGFVDDVHGWNFANNTKNSTDDQNHGSHCAGVIGATGNNGVGITGVNWNVTMMPVKFLDASGGGTLQGAVDSINYARMMKVNIMSNSWGGGGFSQALFDAIKAAKDQGILFVAAAGNDGSNNDGGSPTYPAGYEVANVLSVAATDNKDILASFSNFGKRTVHVAAPGVNIYSAIKGSTYKSYSGTSMATPHVAGIAALLMAEFPEWTFDQIKDRLIKTSTPIAGLRRKVVSKGRVNALNAYLGIIPPSDEPNEEQWRSRAQVIETEHPYKDSIEQTFPVSVPGVKYIRLSFEKIETENRYDKITIEKPNGEVIEEITGVATNYVTDYVQGDALVIRFKTDSSVTKWGFKVDKVQFIGENISE